MVVELNKNLGQPEGTDGSSKKATNSSGQPAGTGNLDGSISDIKFDDVPENMREQMQKLLIPKAKHLQSMISKKSEELKMEKEALADREKVVANLEVWRQEFEKDPNLTLAFEKFYHNYKSGKVDTSEKVDKGLKVIDKAIEQASDEDRPGLEKLKVMLNEGAKEAMDKTVSLETEVNSLKEELISLKSASQIGVTEKVRREVSSLRSRFGKEFVDKHETAITTMAKKYPQEDAETILFLIAKKTPEGLKEYKQALLKEVEFEKKKELDKLKGGIDPAGSSVTTTVEAPRDKGGRVILGGEDGLLRRILRKKGVTA